MSDDLIAWFRVCLDEEERRIGETEWASISLAPIDAERRALAEIDVKRRILDEHKIVHDLSDYARSCGDGLSFGCARCHDWDGVICGNGYCLTVRLLASPYASHPGYRDEWRP